MANITLTNLPTVTGLNGTESLLGVQSGASVQITASQIVALGQTTPNGNVTAISYTATKDVTAYSAVGAFTYGALNYSDLGQIGVFSKDFNGDIQLSSQNISAGASASVNYIVANNLGTATTFYGEFGINSSGYTGTGSLNKASAVYLAATSGDLVIGTTTNNPIRFVVNSGTTDAMIIDTSRNVVIGGASAGTGAIVDVQSTTKGVRFPNMTTTQKNAIVPAAGTVIFDTTLAKLCVYSGSAWQTITSV